MAENTTAEILLIPATPATLPKDGTTSGADVSYKGYAVEDSTIQVVVNLFKGSALDLSSKDSQLVTEIAATDALELDHLKRALNAPLTEG
ncbi:hypothetical protein BDV98DRAFT_376176 [Pterulicium gracile]|uniref:Uncharacterized protein n=1 Tax=Pterulicium gracile TaxID=1884261 RepID=A0A5C3Q0W8_9AGAR|nr:hypothetical protein BDV98DRAFT_376176 [Pterula gracilis]